MFKKEISNEFYEAWEDEKTGLYCGYSKDAYSTTFIQIPSYCCLINKSVHEIAKEFPELNIDDRLNTIENKNGNWVLSYVFCKEEDYETVKGERSGNIIKDMVSTIMGDLIVKNSRDLNYIKEYCSRITQEIKKLMVN